MNHYYGFSLRKVQTESPPQNTNATDDAEINYRVQLYDEVLGYSYNGDGRRIRKGTLIDTGNTQLIFAPESKYELLFGKSGEVYQRLLVTKAMTAAFSRSFIFSREFLSELRGQDNDDPEFTFNRNILERMVQYGNIELFVIGTDNSGMISMNALPLAFKYRHGNSGAVGNAMIPLNGPSEISDDAYTIINDVVEDMNIVLTQIVPGLTISVQDLGPTLLKSGAKGHMIQLMADKNSKKIPLKYESEGIKKIISVLQLFIVMYNNASITVAIDELDSGIFEYLLGELLRILSEKGKGQMIFTSHNLRSLETLDRGFIAFTTTNPDNRYLRLTNIKSNNNLRDFYFRDIVLGEQSEEVYESTNNAEIVMPRSHSHSERRVR